MVLIRFAIAAFLMMSSSVALASTINFDLPSSSVVSNSARAGAKAVAPSGYVGEVLTGYVLSIAGKPPASVALSEFYQLDAETLLESAAQSVAVDARTQGRVDLRPSNPFPSFSGGSGTGSPGPASVEVTPGNESKGPGLPTGPQRLDFDKLSPRINYGSVLTVGPAVITNTEGGNIFVYHSGDYGLPKGGGFCALDPFDFGCTADFTMDFLSPITKLTFTGYFAKPTDGAFLTVFDGAKVLFEGFFAGNDVNELILFDFSSLLRITRIVVEDRSFHGSGGIAYGNFQFEYYRDAPIVSPVPLSASGLLLLGGLAALVLFEQFARNRRRRLALC